MVVWGRCMKKYFIIFLQVYLLIINTVFAQSASIHQQKMNSVFNLINAVNLNQVSKELVKMQQNFPGYLTSVGDKNIKDYVTIAEQVNKFEKEIKNVSVTMRNGTLQLAYQGHIINVSEIGLDGSMIINDKSIVWNPKTDAFSDLENKIKSIIRKKERISFFNLFFPSAKAFLDPVSALVCIMIIGLAVSLFVNLWANFDDQKQLAHQKIKELKKGLEQSLNRCEADLKDTKSLKDVSVITENNLNETLRFIKYVEFLESAKSYEQAKKLNLLNCDYIKNLNKSFIASMFSSYADEINETCLRAGLLEKCLQEHQDSLNSEEKTVNTERNSIIKISPESDYSPMFQSLDPDGVKAK